MLKYFKLVDGIIKNDKTMSLLNVLYWIIYSYVGAVLNFALLKIKDD